MGTARYAAIALFFQPESRFSAGITALGITTISTGCLIGSSLSPNCRTAAKISGRFSSVGVSPNSAANCNEMVYCPMIPVRSSIGALTALISIRANSESVALISRGPWLVHLLLFALGDIFPNRLRRLLQGFGSHFQIGEQFHLLAPMIEGSLQIQAPRFTTTVEDDTQQLIYFARDFLADRVGRFFPLATARLARTDVCGRSAR